MGMRLDALCLYDRVHSSNVPETSLLLNNGKEFIIPENTPIKEPVPSEHAIQKAEDISTEQGSEADHSDYAPKEVPLGYVPPEHHPIDDDEHHDGSGLT